MKHYLLVPALAALLASGAVSADDSTGFYAGVSVERNGIDDDLEGVPLDNDDFGYQIAAGYRFNRYFGLEAGWRDLGEIDASADIAGVVTMASAEADGFSLALNGYVPLSDRFALRAQLGTLAWDVSARVSVAGVSAGASDDGSDLFWGLGAEYEIADAVTLFGQYTRFMLDDAEVNSIGVGATFRF